MNTNAFLQLRLLLLLFFGNITDCNAIPTLAATAAGQRRPLTVAEYTGQRNALYAAEQRLATGSRLRLTAAERLVDVHLKRLKRAEFEAGIRQPGRYAPGLHFSVARPLIERSPVFELLRRMPKGAALHGHNAAMVSAAWWVRTLTYVPGMLRCRSAAGDGDGSLFTFRRADWHQCVGDYVRVADERAAAAAGDGNDPTAYDAELALELSMFGGQPAPERADINAVWQRFDGIFRAVSDAISYEHTFGLVYERVLQEMYDDRVMYLEIRTGFTLIYYDDERTVTERDVVRQLQRIIDEFRAGHPGFLGVKFIYSKSRNTDNVEELLSTYRRLKAEFPDLIVGFDLVGQEDIGKPLIEFVDILLRNSDIEFMFHAGETDWSGYGSDRNLLDAILLNTTRIGHGYSLLKHPLLLDIVRRRHICLEVCPISNQVLGLVNDLRNHPATVYGALDVPMVIASDDPGFWGASGLSYDFYYALMSFTGVDTGLAYVKQLAMNSLRYSRLSLAERTDANRMFGAQWNAFLADVISAQNLTLV